MKRGLIGPKVALTFVLPFGDSLSIQIMGESTVGQYVSDCAWYFKGLMATPNNSYLGTFKSHFAQFRIFRGEETYCPTLGERRHTAPPQGRGDILFTLGERGYTVTPWGRGDRLSLSEETYSLTPQGRGDILSLPRVENTYCHSLGQRIHTVTPQGREYILSLPGVEKTYCHSLGQIIHTVTPQGRGDILSHPERGDILSHRSGESTYILSLPRGEGRGEVALINYNTVPLSVVKYSHDFSFP